MYQRFEMGNRGSKDRAQDKNDEKNVSPKNTAPSEIRDNVPPKFKNPFKRNRRASPKAPSPPKSEENVSPKIVSPSKMKDRDSEKIVSPLKMKDRDSEKIVSPLKMKDFDSENVVSSLKMMEESDSPIIAFPLKVNDSVPSGEKKYPLKYMQKVSPKTRSPYKSAEYIFPRVFSSLKIEGNPSPQVKRYPQRESPIAKSSPLNSSANISKAKDGSKLGFWKVFSSSSSSGGGIIAEVKDEPAGSSSFGESFEAYLQENVEKSFSDLQPSMMKSEVLSSKNEEDGPLASTSHGHVSHPTGDNIYYNFSPMDQQDEIFNS